jgi:hypothetical protein
MLPLLMSRRYRAVSSLRSCIRSVILLYLSMRGTLQDITLDFVEVERTWRWSWGRHCSNVYVELEIEYSRMLYTTIA